MWKPKNLLRPDVIKTLEEADFTDLKIEFLGWLSYNAAALNNSRNPARAAHTLLAKESNVEMIKKFIQRKHQSVRPANVADHSEADELFTHFTRWQEGQFPEKDNDHYAPED